jgi:hypothetical protein
MLPSRIEIDVTANGFIVKMISPDGVVNRRPSDTRSLARMITESLEPVRLKAKTAGFEQKDEAYQGPSKSRGAQRTKA